MPRIVTKSSQDAAQRLHSLLDEHLMSALQPAIDAETEPLKKEIEAHRLLVNEHVEIARKTASGAAEALSAKENALIETNAKLAEVEAQIGHLNTLLSERDADIAKLRTEAHDHERTLELRTIERDTRNAMLNPKTQAQQPE